MFEKPTVSACRGLILTKAPRFLLNAESSLLLPQDCRAPPSATRTKVPAPRGERRGDPQSGSITAASADQRAPKSRVRWARGRTLGPKPLPHNPPQVTPLLPALGLEAASASGQPGLVLSAEAPGLLSSTWGGLCPAPADPAAGPAPARPSPVLIGSCSHPSPLDPPLDPPPTPPEDLPAGNRPRSSPVSGPEPCPGAWFPRGCAPAGSTAMDKNFT
nr:PREDICTED: vegetative cell wall protein gp1-like [Bos mutus]